MTIHLHIYLFINGIQGTFAFDFKRMERFAVVFNKDPGGFLSICHSPRGSNSNLLLCEIVSLAAAHMWAANVRNVCSPLHHNLWFIKKIYFLPSLYIFSGLQTLTKCPSLCSLMMIYESYPEDVVRSRDVLWV